MITRNAGLAASLATALALLGASANAQTPPTTDTATGASASTPASGTPTPSATLNDMDKLFMLRAAQGDMAEISTSNMALKKAKDSSVKQTAQRLVTDHSQSLKEGSGLAVLLGLPMPKDPGAMNIAFAQKLTSAGGKDFDKQYMAGQAEAHENTIALYNMELSQGQDPQVKAFAAKYLPGIEAHSAQIYQVATSVGAPDTNLRPANPPMVAGVLPSSDMPGMNNSAGSALSGMSSGAGGTTGGASTGMTGNTGAGAGTARAGSTGTSSVTTGAGDAGANTGAAGAGGAGSTGTGATGTGGGGAGTTGQ